MDDELHDTPCPLDRLPVLEPKPIDITLRDAEGRWLPGTPCPSPGRPVPKHTISDQLRVILNLTPKEAKTFQPETGAQVIALAMYHQALKDPQVLRELLNRVEGKVTETIEIDQRNVSIVYELIRRKDEED